LIIAPTGRRILLATLPIDGRKGMDALSGLVQQMLGANVFSGDLFIFRTKRSDRVKLLAWDGSGLWLCQKRLEKRFAWPPIRQGVINLTAAQMAMLLEGLDWTRVSPMKINTPSRAC
jgi:transposase